MVNSWGEPAFCQEHLFDEVRPPSSQAQRSWQSSLQSLVEAKSDRGEIAAQLKRLLKENPDLATEHNRYLLSCLDKTLQPSSAPHGSVEAAIDDLTELHGSTSLLGSEQPDARYVAVAQLGFKAVPELIDHLDDDRLTRVKVSRFNNFPPYIKRVRDVVSDYLQELAGSDLEKNWLRRRQGYAVDKKDALKWWKKARSKGEENYLVENVLPRDTAVEWPNSLHLWLLAQRYSKRLPAVYMRLLDDRPQMQSWPVVEALKQSSLGRAQKLELLNHAGRHKNLEHRRAAFWLMKELDRDRFVQMLIGTLKSLPATPEGEYWCCREASFANLVMETHHPEAWRILKKVAQRSDIGLRMELMNPMDYTYVGDRFRKQRLEFLSHFLDDASIRDARNNPKFSGPCAGFAFPVLEVRNLAAMKIASFFGSKIDETPNSDWPVEKWAAYRQRVRNVSQTR